MDDVCVQIHRSMAMFSTRNHHHPAAAAAALHE
jgi:hypothetical protein